MLTPFVYRAKLVRIIDGDTQVFVVDAGFGIHLGDDSRLPFEGRLLRVDTREMNSNDMVVRKQAVADLSLTTQWYSGHRHVTDLPWPWLLRTERHDHFTRYLVEVECPEGHNLSDWLLTNNVPVWQRP